MITFLILFNFLDFLINKPVIVEQQTKPVVRNYRTTVKEYKIPTTEERIEIQNYIREVFGENSDMALAIAHAENGYFSQDRISITSDYGIFQINHIHCKEFGGCENLKDWKKNIDAAKVLYDRRGWQPWSVYKNKKYKRNLTSTGAYIQ